MKTLNDFMFESHAEARKAVNWEDATDVLLEDGNWYSTPNGVALVLKGPAGNSGPWVTWVDAEGDRVYAPVSGVRALREEHWEECVRGLYESLQPDPSTEGAS
jgi:hypothetical protein